MHVWVNKSWLDLTWLDLTWLEFNLLEKGNIIFYTEVHGWSNCFIPLEKKKRFTDNNIYQSQIKTLLLY